MKKNNRNQLELPILTEVSTRAFQSSSRNSRQNVKSSVCFSDNVKTADSEDIKIYHSISNAYFKALSTQKR